MPTQAKIAPQYTREITFNGRLRTQEDACTIGPSDFQTLQNMRYTDTHVRGIGGMSKINSAAISNIIVRNGIFFRKDNVAENFALVQAHNSISAAPTIYSCTAVPPATGAFASLYVQNVTAATAHFATAPDNRVIICDGVETLIYGGVEGRVAGYIDKDDNETYIYDYTDKVNNNQTDSANIATLHASGFDTTLYVGTVVPAQAFKFYMVSANTDTAASAMSVFYNDGNSWQAVGGLSDGTITGGKVLGQTGTVSFNNTATAAKLSSIDDKLLYWYKFSMASAATATTISRVTVNSAVQPVRDIWDGEYIPVGVFQKYTAATTFSADYSPQVLENEYDPSTSLTRTYADLGTMAAAYHLEVGFAERVQGIRINMGESYVSIAASTVTASYWNGGAWVQCSGVSDGTNLGGASFGKSGLITWGEVGENVEHRKRKAAHNGDEMNLYTYKLEFSGGLTLNARCYYVAGVPAQKDLGGYKFPVHHGSRVWLMNNAEKDPNEILVSSVNTAVVYNGDDSTVINLGDGTGIVAGASLYSRFGSNAYNMLVACKAHETWAIIGDNPENFVVYRVSDTIGCVAPRSMVSVQIGGGEVPGISRNVAIWQSHQGIVMFDGTNIDIISNDIGDRFDPRSSTAINSSYKDAGVGFYDPNYNEYHFLCVGAGASAHNEEWVYDLGRRKWWQAVRANPLACGFQVRDTNGNVYAYGADNTGFVFRLENGNDLNGSGITQTVKFGDIALHKGSIMENTQIDWSVLVSKAKTNATGTVSATHFGDGITSGSAMASVDPTKAGYRIVNTPIYTTSRDHTFHSFQFSMTTNDETVGFEPLYYGITYRTIRREA